MNKRRTKKLNKLVPIHIQKYIAPKSYQNLLFAAKNCIPVIIISKRQYVNNQQFEERLTKNG